MVVAQTYLIIIFFFLCHNDVCQGKNVYSFLFAFYPKGLEKCYHMKMAQDWKACRKKLTKSKLSSKNHDYALSGRHCADVQNWR